MALTEINNIPLNIDGDLIINCINVISTLKNFQWLIISNKMWFGIIGIRPSTIILLTKEYLF